MTARILIALVMASLGAAMGAMLAVRINRPKTVVRPRRRNAVNPGAAAVSEAAMWNSRDVFNDGPARRPISAHEELGDALDSPGPLVNRRRSLAVEHEEQPFQPREIAPLPGGAPQIFDIAAAPLDLGAFPTPAPAPVPAPGPVVATQPQPQPQPVLDWSVPRVAAVQTIPSPNAEPAMPVMDEAPRIFGMAAQDGHVPAEFVRAAGFRTSVFEADTPEPLFAERKTARELSVDQASPAPPVLSPAVAVPETCLEPEKTSMMQSSAIEAPAPQPSSAGLGMTDLAQRLQESMARRRAAKGDDAAVEVAAVAPAPIPQALGELAPPATDASAFVPPPRIDIFAAAASEHPVEAFSLPQPPIAMPAALRPIALDLAEDDQESTDLAQLMPRHLVMPQTTPIAPVQTATPELPEPASLISSVDDAPMEAAIPADNAFASLLSIETPRQDFVRIEEPEEPCFAVEPVVIFPGQMAAVQQAARPFDGAAMTMVAGTLAAAPATPAVDPAEAELALRSALANLQRISGAA